MSVRECQCEGGPLDGRVLPVMNLELYILADGGEALKHIYLLYGNPQHYRYMGMRDDNGISLGATPKEETPKERTDA